MRKIFCVSAVLAAFLVPSWSYAAGPKIDKETCIQLKAEQMKFTETGILADINRGPEYAKSNLSPDRIREIELYIALDEQLKFGCREVTITIDMQRASEEAKRLEINPDADPNAPPPAAAPAAPAVPTDGAKGADTGAAGAAKPQAQKAVEKPAATPAAKPRPAAASSPKAPKANDAYKPPEGAQSSLEEEEQPESGSDGDGQAAGRTDVP